MTTCKKCCKYFNYNYMLVRHNNNKRDCQTEKNIIRNCNDRINKIDNKINEITIKSLKKIRCLFCDKNFSTRSNLLSHINNVCPIKKSFIQDRNDIELQKNKINDIDNNKDFRNQIKILHSTFDKVINNKNASGTVINNTTINNPTINNNNNNLIINVNSFGKENLSHITDDDYEKYLNGFFKGFLNFIEKIYFDDRVPENHNICLTNVRSKYAYVYENNNWVLKEKNEIVDKLITKKYNILNDKFEEYEENNKVSENVLDNFREFQENYHNAEAQKNTKENVILLLYNNREKIKK